MPETIGVAFIGAGSVAQLHGAAVLATPMTRFIGAYDVNNDAAGSIVNSFGGHVFPSIEALLADRSVQVVAVLSPLEYHFEHAAAALRAGKHLLIEKPVAMQVQEIAEIQRLGQHAGLVCMPGHNYIYLPAMRQLKHYIDSGEFGIVTSAWILYNLYHPLEIASKYPGVLRQIMTHHFYVVLYLLGQPSSLVALDAETRAEHQKLNREDQVSVVLKMANGTLVNLFASFAADDQTSDPWTVVFKVLGTEGSGVYNWRDTVILSAKAGLGWRYPAYEDSIQHEWHYLIQQCIQDGSPPLSSLNDAITAQKLIEATEDSISSLQVVHIT